MTMAGLPGGLFGSLMSELHVFEEHNNPADLALSAGRSASWLMGLEWSACRNHG